MPNHGALASRESLLPGWRECVQYKQIIEALYHHHADDITPLVELWDALPDEKFQAILNGEWETLPYPPQGGVEDVSLIGAFIPKGYSVNLIILGKIIDYLIARFGRLDRLRISVLLRMLVRQRSFRGIKLCLDKGIDPDAGKGPYYFDTPVLVWLVSDYYPRILADGRDVDILCDIAALLIDRGAKMSFLSKDSIRLLTVCRDEKMLPVLMLAGNSYQLEHIFNQRSVSLSRSKKKSKKKPPGMIP